jgi:hypothetical protein
MLEVVTEEEILAVATRLLEMSKEGNLAAARLLLSYTIGKPSPSVNPDTLDLAEWHLFDQESVDPEAVISLNQRFPLATVCHLLRCMTPVRSHFLTEEFRQAAHNPPPAPEAEPDEYDETDETDEVVVLAPDRVPNVEDVLPRPSKRRRRKDKTRAADAAPVVPQAWDESDQPGEGWSEGPPVDADTGRVIIVSAAAGDLWQDADDWLNPIRPLEAEVGVPDSAGLPSATSEPEAVPTGPAATEELTSPRSPGSRSLTTSATGLTPPRSPASDVPGPEQGEAAPSVSVPQPPEHASKEIDPRAAGTPVSGGRLQHLLRMLGLTGAAPPSPNGSTPGAPRTEGDDPAHTPLPPE